MEKTFQAGEIVLTKNEFTHNFYVVVRGRIKFEFDGRKFFLSDGDFFGEEGVFFNKANPFSAVAAEETKVQILDKNGAKEFISKNYEAVFSLFIRNSARFFDGIDPLSETNGTHMKTVEALLPYITKSESDLPDCEAGISIEKLSSKLDMSREKLLFLFEFVEPLGYLKLSATGKIFTVGKKEIMELRKKYFKEKVFFDADSGKGSGLSPLVNVLNKKEKKGITI